MIRESVKLSKLSELDIWDDVAMLQVGINGYLINERVCFVAREVPSYAPNELSFSTQNDMNTLLPT